MKCNVQFDAEAISHEFKYLPLVIFGELQTSTWPDFRAPSP